MNRHADLDDSGKPDVFKTAVRGVKEELGIEISEKNIEFLGLAYDVSFCQYDMIGTIQLDIGAEHVMAHRARGTKDSRFEAKQLFLVRYDPNSIVKFLAQHQPWWPRAASSILYSLLHDFGFEALIKALQSENLTRIDYRYH